MKNCGSCGAWIPDVAGFCPSCGKPVGSPPAAADPGPGPASPPVPPPSAPPGGAPPGPPPIGEAERFEAARRVRTLGVLYIVLGVLGFLGAILMVGFARESNVRWLVDQAREELRRNPDRYSAAEREKFEEGLADLERLAPDLPVPARTATILQALFFGALIVSGGMLRQATGQTFGIVMGAGLLVAPLCSWVNCCCFGCCLHPVLGAYALYLLNTREVNAAFATAR